MMLVDTSVWIDFFRGSDTPQSDRLEQALRDRADLALCGIILTETLQGIRDDAQYRRVRDYLQPLILLPMREPVFVRAAQLYRHLRAQGITIRKTNDCIIAATAIIHAVPLLHHDRDFDQLQRHSTLEVFPT